MLDFHKENTALLKIKFQWILITTMLEYLVIQNSFISCAFVYDIANMKCELNFLNLENTFIQQKHYLNCRHLC